MDNLQYIPVDASYNILQAIPTSGTGDSVTAQVKRVSDDYYYNFATGLFQAAGTTGAMTNYDGEVWKIAFTPNVSTPYSVTINDITLDFKYYQTLIATGSVTAPGSPSTHYCTAAEVKKIVINIELSSIDEVHLTMADDVINGKLASKYTLPFSATPPLVKTIAIILTAYFATEAQFSGGQANKSEWVNNKYSQALKLLKDIADGNIELVTSAGAVIERSDTDEVSSNTQDYSPAFGEDDELSQAIDSDKLTDLSGDRG